MQTVCMGCPCGVMWLVLRFLPVSFTCVGLLQAVYQSSCGRSAVCSWCLKKKKDMESAFKYVVLILKF